MISPFDKRLCKPSKPVACFATGLVGLVVAFASSVAGGHDLNRMLCKYSVRDVGFVSIHTFGWQLALEKPEQLSEQEFIDLDQKLNKLLEESNIHHIWLPKDSDQLRNLANKIERQIDSQKRITGVLSNTNDEVFPFSDQVIEKEKISSFLESVESLVDSPVRKQILESCCDSLCVFVLIESANDSKNLQARQMMSKVAEKMKKQMWLLEKPTESPPASIVVSVDEQMKDPWFGKSMGLNFKDGTAASSEPKFAIIYGQGRRLGEVIPMDTASVDKLVGRASVCGGDCECDLDRDWLYGHQFVHRWHKEHERLAETTLDFDPHAAYVKSEVATIVRKAIRKTDPGQKIDLGPGLVIHDLDPLEKQVAKREAKTPTTNSDKKVDSKKVEFDYGFDKKTPASKSIESKANENSTPNWFPAALVLFLVAGIGVAIFWSMSRGS